MEVNKTSKNFFQMSYSEIKQLQNTNNEISSENANIETTSDEEVVLDEALNIEEAQEVSEIEIVDEVSTVDGVEEVSTDVDNTVDTQVENISSANSTSELKTMEEYMEIVDNMYNELYEKFNGDSEQINQYIEDNMSKYADIDGDGRITLIDTAIWTKISNNISAKDEKEKYQSFHKISSSLLQSTGWNRQENLLDLDDLENLFEICGGWRELSGVNIWIKSSLDLSKIAQSENWEERIENLEKTYGINGNLPCFQGSVKSDLKSYSEYAQNNSENTQYYAISQAYKNMQEELNTKDLRAIAKSAWEWNQENLSKDDGDINYTETAIYNQLYNHIYDGAVQTAATKNKDINGDGKVTADDIASFSTNIDLDGDGTVSDKERQFLKQVKEKMETQIYRNSALKNYYNLSTIDDVISSVEVYDETYTDNLKEQKPSYTALNYETGEFEQIEYEDNEIPGYKQAFGYLYNIGGVSLLTRGLQDGTSGITTVKELSSCTASQLHEILKIGVDYLSSTNLYLHYIKSADLSKDELEEILSKINNASSSAQAQLSEVKSAVEEKLSKLEES